jgi:hypothetical protein
MRQQTAARPHDSLTMNGAFVISFFRVWNIEIAMIAGSHQTVARWWHDPMKA